MVVRTAEQERCRRDVVNHRAPAWRQLQLNKYSALSRRCHISRCVQTQCTPHMLLLLPFWHLTFRSSTDLQSTPPLPTPYTAYLVLHSQHKISSHPTYNLQLTGLTPFSKYFIIIFNHEPFCVMVDLLKLEHSLQLRFEMKERTLKKTEGDPTKPAVIITRKYIWIEHQTLSALVNRC